MELLRHVVVLLHIVGFAITFGAWTAEAAAKRFRFTRTMDYGLLLSLLTGLALAAPWPAGIELNYPKIGVKLVILVVIGGVLGMAAHVNGAPAIRLRVRCLFRSGCSWSIPRNWSTVDESRSSLGAGGSVPGVDSGERKRLRHRFHY